MGRHRFAQVATGYVVVVALLTLAGLHLSFRPDVAAFAALCATMPTGLVHGLLQDVPPGFRPYAVPLLAVVNAFLLRWIVSRDPVTRGVEERLHRALVATGVKVTPMAWTGRRRQRSLLLRDVPIVYPQFVGVFRDRWLEAGLRVQQQDEPLALRGYDAEGYEYAVKAGPGVFGDAVLSVTAPPAHRGAFLAGLATAGLPSIVAVLLTTYPVLRIVGCAALAGGLACQAAPRTRTFGRGLLTGGLPPLLVLLTYALP